MSEPRLKLDLNHAFSSVTRGVSEELFKQMGDRLEAATLGVKNAHEAGELPYIDLPGNAAATAATLTVAKRLSRSYETLVVLGIGGSSLGGRAVLRALSHPFSDRQSADKRTGMRVVFPDNSDPATFTALLDVLDLKTTAFAAITKSGGTAETMSQLSIVKTRLVDAVGEDEARVRIVAVTDPTKGALRRIATREGWDTLDVPPGVGGRFSVLTPCGMLPIACAGIDVQALLEGAAAMAERGLTLNARKNPAASLAGLLFAMDTRARRPMHVLMPYADSLRDLGDWFVQLWAESLGKSRPDGPVGPTPLRAVGATDQHSLLQLLMEGPDDKFVTFIGVDKRGKALEVPNAWPDEGDVSYLGGITLAKLIDTEQKATTLALAKRGRPSATITLPRIDARQVGALLMMFELATSVAGMLYDVNPYNQPGVELGKRYTCGMLGRPGYEDSAEEVAALPDSKREWIL